MPDNPLLKVPPASRGNRTHAPHAVPLAKRGDLKEGGNCKLCPCNWYYTNCVAKVCECVGFESPLTPTLSPLDKLVRVHRFGTESLRQGRFSPRKRERAGALCCPHPLCPPLPRGGRGGLWSAEAKLPPTLKLALQHSKNTARGAPLPNCGRGAGGEGEKACEPRTQ